MDNLTVPSFDDIKDLNTQGSAELAVLQKDTAAVLGQQAGMLIETVAPYLAVNQNNVKDYLDNNSVQVVETMRFFKLISCTTEEIEDLSLFLNEKMGRLFTAISSLQTPVAYGVVSYEGKTNLVLGVDSKKAQDVIESFIKGLLTGIEIEPYTPSFSACGTYTVGGVVSAIPIMEIEEEKQKFDISTLMRSINGENYTVLVMAQPYEIADIQKRYSTLVQIRDECFKFSKRNFSEQDSAMVTKSKGESQSKSFSFGAMVGGLFGLMFGINAGGSFSKTISEDVSRALGKSTTTAFDVQNGFALEMMEYCDAAIKRLRQAQNVGLWGSALIYSADKSTVGDIIQACLSGELAKPAAASLPPSKISYSLEAEKQILIPKLTSSNPLLAPITSSELGMLCTPPFESVPDFELKKGKLYPMVGSSKDGVVIGKVSDGNRPIETMDFSLSEVDLNKHTFVCGITGSGKTTTVKGILQNCKKPFMVIESAKKEYRNLRLDNKDRGGLVVYTLGKPELNCLQFNPFYIQCGINLQTHIDFLKDLFNASFSFYGPMPYILEKCLHNIYRKKGWNLTLGYHPYLLNIENQSKVFDAGYLESQYSLAVHKYLFPTMQDLRAEVEHYIKTEMDYKGEVADNIKTAMLARLDSLCIGSKGFMLNTVVPIPIDYLMEKNVVFELEGLADDADKAFCVGLLVVYINEYRQIFKDKHFTEKLGLQHLLVIEEAHRLLKNVETERTSENMGNPKGKAVEHFTNMIAEMRSYGQGVIIAEQIPSKLAPDVIKNSSNKIIQRVVSADDQRLVANTIGIKEEDSVYLGNLRTGFALCHKEGMNLPVLVKVNNLSDNLISDDDLLAAEGGKMFGKINLSLMRENTFDMMSEWSLWLLNAVLSQKNREVIESLTQCKQAMKSTLRKKDVSLLFCNNMDALLGQVIAENIVKLLICGAYGFKKIISNDFYKALCELFVLGRYEDVDEVKGFFKNSYMEDPKSRCIRIIAALIIFHYEDNVDIKKSAEKYFLLKDEAVIAQIVETVRKERC